MSVIIKKTLALLMATLLIVTPTPSAGEVMSTFLHAVTEPQAVPAFSVIYNGNFHLSGAAPIDPNDYAEGDSATVLGRGTLERYRFSFEGWNTAPDGSGTTYQEGDSILIPNNDVVLYAIWMQQFDYHYVRFDPGAQGAFDPVEHTFLPPGTETPQPPATAGNPGWTFIGWDPEVYETVTRSIIYIAQWQEIPRYSITYFPGAPDTTGSVPVDPSTYAVGEYVTLKAPGDLARQNFAFVAWVVNGVWIKAPGETHVMLAGGLNAVPIWFPTFSVTYHANPGPNLGLIGTPPVDNVRRMADWGFLVRGNTGGLHLPGFTFTNWNTMPDGTGETYAPGSHRWMPAKDLNLYAQWTEIRTFTVTTYRIPEEGGTTTGDGRYTEGTDVPISAIANPGFVFVRWAIEARVISEVASFTIEDINEDWAIWAEFAPVFTVTYNANSGTGTQTDPYSPYRAEDTVTVLDLGSIEKDGFTFAGWNTAADGSGTDKAVGSTFEMPMANVVLYAQWTEIPTYNVTTSSEPIHGGTTSGGGTFEHGAPVTVTATPNVGFTFVRWSEDGIPRSTNASFTIENIDRHWDLVAHFVPASYNVTTSSEPIHGGTTSGGGTFNHGVSVTVTATPNVGFTFVRWSEDGIPRSTNASFTIENIDRHWDLVAHFVPAPYNVTTSSEPIHGGTTSGGGTFNHGVSVTVTATPNVGFTFVRWSEDGIPRSTNASFTIENIDRHWDLVAHFVPVLHTVTFAPGTQGTFTSITHADLDHGTPTPTPPATPGHPGWTFTGWDPPLAGTVTGTVTYTAQWKHTPPPLSGLTVTFLPGRHGTFAPRIHPNLEPNATTPTPPVPTGAAGFVFTGWSPALGLTVTDTVTYTAQWAPVYTITFAPGAQGTFAPVVHTGVVYGAATPEAPPTTGNTGFVFTGWSPSLAPTVTATATYTAQWAPVFTVTFSPGTQGAFIPVVHTGILAGTTTPIAPPTPGNTGFVFTGWSPSLTPTVTATATYTAQWAPAFTVTFLPGAQGTFDPVSHTGIVSGSPTPAVPPTPGHDGFVFRGWDPVIAPTVMETVTYTAQWEAIVTAPPGGDDGIGLDDPHGPGGPELPQTGEVPFAFYYGLGSAIMAAGILVSRRRRK